MMNLDDIDGNLPPDESPPPDNQRLIRLVALAASVAVVALGIGAYWLLTDDDTEEAPAAPAQVAEAPAPQPLDEPDPALAEPEPVEVPELEASDPFVGAVVGGLSSHPGLAAWLTGERMIRRFVVVVDNVANGRNPAQHLPFMRPGQRFSTTGEAPDTRVAAASYRRYDVHAEIIDSLDADGVGALYGLLEPLLDAAYSELGYPDTPFSNALRRAIDHLLEVPALNGPPAVTRGMVFYEHASERLDALTSAQKQFIGMGPDNVRIVQAKLRAIAQAIGIATSR